WAAAQAAEEWARRSKAAQIDFCFHGVHHFLDGNIHAFDGMGTTVVEPASGTRWLADDVLIEVITGFAGPAATAVDDHRRRADRRGDVHQAGFESEEESGPLQEAGGLAQGRPPTAVLDCFKRRILGGA